MGPVIDNGNFPFNLHIEIIGNMFVSGFSGQGDAVHQFLVGNVVIDLEMGCFHVLPFEVFLHYFVLAEIEGVLGK